MGVKNTDERLQGGAKYLCEYLPKWNPVYEKQVYGSKTFYYWYYATLCMFQQGGESWRAWNGAIRDMLVKNQCTAKDGDLNGSWNPAAGTGRSIEDLKRSRVFSTALGALCLEVYYRYLPMYGD